jgi:hypothetical protein
VRRRHSDSLRTHSTANPNPNLLNSHAGDTAEIVGRVNRGRDEHNRGGGHELEEAVDARVDLVREALLGCEREQ